MRILKLVIWHLDGDRIGEAEELGALVTFLVSAAAGYITGVAINFDGGLSEVV